MAKKIFLSPSNQTENRYAWGDTNEAVQCGKMAEALKGVLERCGFEVKLMHYYTMAEKAAASKTWRADLYVPIHTNAFDGTVSGTRMFCYDLKGEGYKACRAVFKYLAPVSPGKSENIKAQPGLYEVKTPSAPTAYIEVDFHDNPNAARWLVENSEAIAEAIGRGICEYFGYEYKAGEEGREETPEQDVPESLYRVQVGAFRKRENAVALQKQLEEDGYESMIKEEKTQ